MKTHKKLDEIDLKILSLLEHDARIQWRQIGEAIHMSGQAVGERIKQLSQMGVIKGYHTIIDRSDLSPIRIDYITVLLTSGNHNDFLAMLDDTAAIKEAFRISGYGCYLLKVETTDHSELESVLNQIIPFGNYQVSSIISKCK